MKIALFLALVCFIVVAIAGAIHRSIEFLFLGAGLALVVIFYLIQLGVVNP